MKFHTIVSFNKAKRIPKNVKRTGLELLWNKHFKVKILPTGLFHIIPRQ